MAMSKSVNNKWNVKLLMFSGKENPEWEVDEAFAKKILQYCEEAGPWEQDFEIPTILGYNGIEFYNKEKKISAFKSQIKIKTKDKTEIKTDLGRRLEKMILQNAPFPYQELAWQQLNIDFD